MAHQYAYERKCERNGAPCMQTEVGFLAFATHLQKPKPVHSGKGRLAAPCGRIPEHSDDDSICDQYVLGASTRRYPLTPLPDA